MPLPADQGFYSGGQLVAEALRAFLPPEPSNVADFAAAKRWLSNEGGGYVGRWNHAEAPYLIGPMEALCDDRYLSVAVVGPAQCGKTEIARNWLLSSALSDPADMLWYSGSEPLVTTEVKVNMSRMIQDHPDLAAIQQKESLAFKKFGSMNVQFLAGIMSNLVSKSAPRIVGDEWDMICQALPAAKSLVDARRQTFGRRSKFLAISHPDLVQGYEAKHWDAGIMEMFRDSTRKIWYWHCPVCGACSSPNPTARRVMTIDYDERAPDDEIAAMARLACPVNGCLIEDSQRRGMNMTGKWVGLGQEIDEAGAITGALAERETDGYWITGAMSPFVIGGIGTLAVERARAERKYAITGERKPFAQVMSKRWGVMLEKDTNAGALEAGVIAARAEADLVLGQVANGVRFITVMIDVQGNRFELLARGWCADGGSVVVDFRRIDAAPATSADDWNELLNFATGYSWPLADGSGRGMKAVSVVFDCNGMPGVTAQGYAAWSRLRAARTVRLLGRIDGRPAYNVLPLKGGSSIQAPRLQVVFPDGQRNDRFSGIKGEIPLGIFNPNLFKDDLNGQLLLADGGPGSIRFPAALEAAWFEQLVAEIRTPTGRWEKQKGKPNEALDLLVGCHVAATLMGLRRIKWDHAEPQWARPWDENVNVGRLSEALAPLRPAGVSVAQPLPSPPKRALAAVEARVKLQTNIGPRVPPMHIVTSVPVRR